MKSKNNRMDERDVRNRNRNKSHRIREIIHQRTHHELRNASSLHIRHYDFFRGQMIGFLRYMNACVCVCLLIVRVYFYVYVCVCVPCDSFLALMIFQTYRYSHGLSSVEGSAQNTHTIRLEISS